MAQPPSPPTILSRPAALLMAVATVPQALAQEQQDPVDHQHQNVVAMRGSPG